MKLYVCGTTKQPLPSLLAGEGWQAQHCVQTEVITTPKACQVEHSTELCTTNTVPVPTASQAAYQRHEIAGMIHERLPCFALLTACCAGLTHFNMATYVTDGDPACNPSNWNTGVGSSNPDLFNPEKVLATGVRAPNLLWSHIYPL